jgi:hypothetical protein
VNKTHAAGSADIRRPLNFRITICSTASPLEVIAAIPIGRT